ncbi:Protein CBR-SET-3 [Caenorhabditis briggsae]|uniref:Protein CBR-SET-3 n=1 Tax=Caenorhabditis briggsae TaxID=6238 RepID=A8XA69_CAEBR|nr:Protein CBR-SET-3 [Caenorhabditis briggsae]CAP29537.2 Protein CBR-SET-3 [Caenorhabditis briggsae]
MGDDTYLKSIKMVSVPSFRPNSNFPQLCDKVTVGWDARRGRFVQATEDIPIGTVVCVEQGITVNVDQSKCYRCLKQLGDDGFAYCESCEEFYEPDAIACGDFDGLGIFKLSAHLVFSYPFLDMANLIRSNDPEIPQSAPTYLSTKDVTSVFQLTPYREIGEAFKEPPLQAAINKIVTSLEDDANWGRLEYNSRLVTFTKALRIMAERCAKNAHTIYGIDQMEAKDKKVPLGTGLFPISSIFNHSCTPNVYGFFVRNTFIFVSRGVKAGEELVDSYGVTYNQHTLQQRTYGDYLKPGSKEIEDLIVEFGKRRDAEVYTEHMFMLWKKFVENAKLRGIDYDPYLIHPYIEMVILSWNNEVECSEEEKASLLFITHRLLRNFYVGFHPVSDIIPELVDQSAKYEINQIRNTVERLIARSRSVWEHTDYQGSQKQPENKNGMTVIHN